MEYLGANLIKSSKNLLNKSQMNDSTNNESSYHLNSISIQDSLCEHDFAVPFASPYVLDWEARNKQADIDLKKHSYANLSDIEHKRGADPDEEGIECGLLDETIKSSKENDSKENKLIENNLERDRLSSISQQSKWIDLNRSSDAYERNWMNTSSHSTKSLLDLSNVKIHKKLEYSASIDHKDLSTSFASNTTLNSSNRSLSNNNNNNKENENNNLNDKNTDLEMINQNELFEIIDKKLDEKIRKRQLLNNSTTSSTKKYDKLKKTNTSLTWEIPNDSNLNQSKNTDIITDTITKPLSSKLSNSLLKTKIKNINYEKEDEELASVTSISDLTQNDKSYDDPAEISDLVNMFYMNLKVQENNSENVLKSNPNSEKKVLTDKNTNKKLSTKSVNTTFENKPEKYITEACTQTSFVIPVATVAEYTNQQQSLSKKMPEQESNQENSTVKKSSRNNRVEKIIEYEKKQHDKRIRELEKLAYMEKLHGEKLRQIMLQTDNESFAALLNESFQNSISHNESSHLYKSQHDTTSRRKSDTLLRTDVDKSKLKNFDNNINDLSIIPSNDHNYIQTSISHQVEILNLKNTTVLVPPDNVKIIKEIDNPSNRNRLSLGLSNNPIAKVKPQQTNEIFADEDGRLFFSLTTTNAKTKSTSSLSSASSVSSTVSAKSIKPKVAEQINNMYKNIDDEFRSQPVKARTLSLSTNTSTSLRRPNSPPIPVQLQMHSSSSEPLIRKQKQYSHKMSLQEAFETYRHDLLIRSRERQNNIKLKAEKRMAMAQLRLENAELNNDFKVERQQAKKQREKNQVEKQMRRPQLSTNEIKQITRKNYEKLPEVKEKQAKQRVEMDKKLNRFRSSIYQKTIQQHVLTKGTNFHLNFKAFEDM